MDLRCVELMSMTVKFAKRPKVNGEIIWPLNQRRELKAGIEEVLRTGVEKFVPISGGLLYHIRPEYPLIDSAMLEPGNRDFLKVHVRLYSQMYSLGVKNEKPSVPAEWPKPDVNTEGRC